MKKARPSIYHGFGVVTRQGRFLWQYLRHNEEETRTAYEAHNPQVEGCSDGHKIVKVRLSFQE